MRNHLFQRLFLFGCVLMPAFAGVRADTLSSFSFNASFTNGATASGSAVVDVTVGTVTSFNVGITGPGGYTLTGPLEQGPLSGGYYAADINRNEEGVVLSFSQSSLVGYAGGQLCSISMPCTGYYPATYYGDSEIGNFSAQSATLTPLSSGSAPEIDPSLGYGTVLMLAGGIVVLRGRRRAPQV